MGENSLPRYGSVASGNRIVRTRLLCGVGRAGERPALTRCTPGMGVILWGESPLYVNPAPSFYDGSESTSRRQGNHLKVVSLSADRQVKEAGVQRYEPTNRNGIQGPVFG